MNCKATTKSGRMCSAQAVAGGDYCFMHDPARAHERVAARRRGGHNRRTPKAVEGDGSLSRLRCVADVQEALERALTDTWVQENSGARTQAVVRLCMAALKAIEVGELEERVKALEERLREEDSTRPGGETACAWTDD